MSFEGSRFVCEKATSEKKGISNEIVIQVIINEVPQLAGHMACGKRHGGARGCERDIVVVVSTAERNSSAGSAHQ